MKTFTTKLWVSLVVTLYECYGLTVYIALLSDDDASARKVPSLKVALYGVNRIMYPTMLWQNTPELLELLSLSELYRQKIISNCEEALQWNRFYIKKGASESVDGTPLTIKDVSLLENVLRKSGNEILRETYRNLVLQVCSSVCLSVHFNAPSVKNMNLAHILFASIEAKFAHPCVFFKILPSSGELDRWG